MQKKIVLLHAIMCKFRPDRNADFLNKKSIFAMQADQPLFKGLSLEELKAWAAAHGEKPYRARQLYQWMYQKYALTFEEMSDISRPLRERLAAEYTLSTVSVKEMQVSQIDQSKKFLFELQDGNHVEAVYMMMDSRITVCLSTQIGCPIGCSYCATGLMGFIRNLTTAEILDQFITIARRAERPVTNIVFMGMGEPFLNYDNVIKAAQIFNSELGPGIGARKITISTSGLLPALERYSQEGHRFKIAVSLNGSTNEQRDRLVPINRKYPIEKIIAAAHYYTKKARHMITFEYILIDGFNDSVEDARRLRSLLGQLRCKLNIIPFNENEHSHFRRPPEEKLEAFVNALWHAPFTITVRRSKGVDISAACGQLYARTLRNSDAGPKSDPENL